MIKQLWFTIKELWFTYLLLKDYDLLIYSVCHSATREWLNNTDISNTDISNTDSCSCLLHCTFKYFCPYPLVYNQR